MVIPLNIIIMETNYFDVTVVGSGFGAGPPALRLQRAGLSTVVLEKGPNIDPKKDLKITQDPKYLLRYLKSLKSDSLTMNYVEGLGGGSVFFEKVVLRAPEFVFNQKDKDGRPLWPAKISRKSLDPYYKIGEVMLRAHQMFPERIPKTGQVFSLLMKKLGYSVDRARYSDSHCTGCGYCVFGCTHNSKESLLVNYLPKAVDHGAIIHTDKEVMEVRSLMEESRQLSLRSADCIPYRFESIARDTRTGNIIKYRSKYLVLAASTLGTAKILFNSRKNLSDLSAQVGRNVAINGSVKAAAILPDWCPDADMFTGQSHPGMVSYEFLKSHGIMISAVKAMPLQLFGTARLSLNGEKFWGTDHVELMKKLRRRIIILDAHGVTAPGAELRPGKGDSIQSKMRIDYDLTKYYKETREVMESILVDSGCQLINIDYVNRKGQNYRDLHFFTSHQVGSCRMAENKARGVVNPQGEVFGYPGMYITDGAAVPSSTGVNVSLTILANSERITHGIINSLK
jgi:choline dehydrogenase-like flavoprotein